MNIEAVEFLQKSSPLHQTRTHRALYVEDDKVIVPELIYESKYTPNSVAMLLQHELERKEGIADRCESSTNRGTRNKLISVMRKSDYISPITTISSPQRHRLLSPLPSRQGSKMSAPFTAPAYGVVNVHTQSDLKDTIETSLERFGNNRNVIRLQFLPTDAHQGSVHSPTRINSLSPSTRIPQHLSSAPQHKTTKPQSPDYTETESDPPMCLRNKRDPTPSRVTSNISHFTRAHAPSSENFAIRRHGLSSIYTNSEPGLSILSVMKGLLAPPTPQVHCTSPSLRAKFLDG